MEKEAVFTEEQVRELAENRYTYRVSSKSISFTPEFMRLLCRKKAVGEPNRKIFEECGYDPNLLGRYRMSNAVRRTKGKRPEEIRDHVQRAYGYDMDGRRIFRTSHCRSRK